MEQMDLSQRIISNWGISSPSLASEIRNEIDKAVSEKGLDPVKETVGMLTKYTPRYPLQYLKKALLNVVPTPAFSPQPKEFSYPSEYDLNEKDSESGDKWIIDGRLTDEEENDAREMNDTSMKFPSLFPGWQEPMNDREWHVMCTLDEDAWFWRQNPQYKENTFISVYRKAKLLGVSMHDICRKEKLVYRLLFREKILEEKGEE